ncbi:tryptophan synthase subunit alpha [Actinoplanes cyaneus]|uniref:Tryptophan synthase subunit alpha n=1 Tax=Actinoplanes cyaneus TaxID=52696 RepID=A0A919ITS8_9ACTN|nr:NAD(P)/FAD-dependent oxidoreductase [Actinoplanes cyaneus]MCW2142389.1 tryptophan 2-monooxygenase [Actinoplanes cyaneus]GID70886.1 tryptophan synthase subunit alpha [Actinoplanes cyaneus]
MTTLYDAPPVTMLGPDFPFGYDRWLTHPAGLGQVPPDMHGTPVAVVGGGISGLVAAYELMRLGLRPVVFEAEQLGGRMRTARFPGHPDTVAELGAMRFPASSAALLHYVELLGLRTRPFPNPLARATPHTVVDVNGSRHFTRTGDDLPSVYHEVSEAWQKTLEESADLAAMDAAIRHRDVATIKALWNRLVPILDDQSFYGFLASSPSFASFRHRELFGQVGFGSGGWDTDFPNSVLEILRVVYTGADADHHALAGGAQRLPLGLWEHSPAAMAHWPRGTSLATLHPDGPRPAVTRLSRARGWIRVETAGEAGEFTAAVLTPQVRLLTSRIDTDESLFPTEVWTAIERTHYMGGSKLFALVDRPFWHDLDAATGRPAMGMTLTDRTPRGVYLFDDGPSRPGVMCLSYTWNDDSLKVSTLPPAERLEVMLRHLRRIYPGVDIAGRIIAAPIAVTWENEPHFLGAFKANLPGHYRYQRRLFTHFMQDDLPRGRRGVFLAGDDVSWTGGFAEGAVTTALNAVWGVLHHLGGRTHPDNPGPGDAFAELAPIDLPY